MAYPRATHDLKYGVVYLTGRFAPLARKKDPEALAWRILGRRTTLKCGVVYLTGAFASLAPLKNPKVLAWRMPRATHYPKYGVLYLTTFPWARGKG